jgi:phospholipid-binding lipoprotein MlaA
MNRVVFDFNQFVDRILLKPAAQVYAAVLPDFAQGVIHNILTNANEPVTFMNAALQGRTKDAGATFNRFLVNTIAGLGGIGDVASAGGLNHVDADFGQTLHVWGAPEGPYLVLPILGPSNPRDAIGFAVDSIAEPWPYAIENAAGPGTRNRYLIAQVSANALDKRSSALDALDALEKGSVDFYAQLRSVSRQYRKGQLNKANNASQSQRQVITGVFDDSTTTSATPVSTGAQPVMPKAKKHKKKAVIEKPEATSAAPGANPLAK